MYFIRTIYLGFRDLSGRENKRITVIIYLLEEVIVSNEEVIVAFHTYGGSDRMCTTRNTSTRKSILKST